MATPPNQLAAPGILSASRQGLTKAQILQSDSQWNKAFDGLVKTKIRAESDPEQTKVFAKIRRNNLYYRGMQYLQMIRLPDGNIDYRPVSSGGMTPYTPPVNRDQDEMFDNILPLFRGDVRKWCGVLGVRSPNAKCEPRTVGDDNQARLSRIGDRAVSYLRDAWESDKLQRYLSYSLAVNGTTFGFVDIVSDPKKYGVTSIPKLEIVEVPAGEPYFQCAKCGTENAVQQTQATGECSVCNFLLGPEDYREADTVPGIVQTGVTQYANCAVELQLATGATVKTPYYVTDDREKIPWVWYEYLVNKYELIRTYAPRPAQGDNSPEARFAKELREHLTSDSTGSTAQGVSTAEVRRTLNTLSSPSGSPYERKSLAAFSQYYVSPGQIEAIDNDDSGNLREQLLATYPKGVRLTYLAGKLADISEKAIAEHVSICQPDTGEFIWRDAVFDDYIQGVDVINDTLNILIQQAEKSNPLTVFDPDVLDPDTLRGKQVAVGEFLEGKRGVGSQLAQSFFRISPSEVSDALMKFLDYYIQKNRENVGIMPAIYGGGEADEAVGVAKLRRNQSLMQLNIPWNYMRDFWSQTYENAIRLLARYSNGKLVMNKGGNIQIEELDGIWELEQGGIVVQCEEAMPMTWAQRQERVQELTQMQGPLIAATGLLDTDGSLNPTNIEVMQDAIGMPDWEVPGLAAKERLLDIIDQLVKAEPIDQPPAPAMPGAPPAPPQPPQPSIQPNQLMFDAPFAVKVLRQWINGEKGREAERGELPGQTPRGFENVLAHLQAWMNIANPPAPPAPPPPPMRANVSITGKLEDMPPDMAGQILQDIGIQAPPPQPGPPGLPPPGPPVGKGAPPAPNGGPPPPDQRQLAGPPQSPEQVGLALPPAPGNTPTGTPPGSIQ